ncbi:RNA polymerase sigma factor [Paenibacillus chitinolyticus]|uniref:Sigma-70 family RNA polymerase sigma factor n=1 Tax=Paenibacillus chitinolyticus TaxID=79263 RepID=A0A410WR88_9BACL|nr:sigma-70 family RNA polymerase sigma factor [Paenibacillus chitinolyticus]MCY9591544.1 sigma-70 family RNA polymerase sigma factor [Paenibacillus chitinolyticus]MCY9594623.1 sigma-70 family RNA polymerase sigma factor [Paenibacillus chitinolyticus]QAV16863.1 sigma-70 family RNA polymerase sigma factor [Paenibacillus chitinolyticus]
MGLEELYKEIQPKMYAFFYVKTQSREAAEDLTQEVFYEAVKGHGSFRGDSTVRTWLFGIAKHKLSKYYRSKKYGQELAAKLAAESRESVTPEKQVLDREDRDILLERIFRLDEGSQEIVTLRMYAELSFREIGHIIGATENSVRVRFHRIKLQLHKELEGYYER